MVRSHGRRSGLSEVDRFKADEVTTPELFTGSREASAVVIKDSGTVRGLGPTGELASDSDPGPVFDALCNTHLSPGDHIEVGPGTYTFSRTEDIGVAATRSVGSPAGISVAGRGATFELADGMPDQHILWAVNQDGTGNEGRVRFEGIHWYGNAPNNTGNTQYCIMADGFTSYEVEGCWFEDWRRLAVGTFSDAGLDRENVLVRGNLYTSPNGNGRLFDGHADSVVLVGNNFEGGLHFAEPEGGSERTLLTGNKVRNYDSAAVLTGSTVPRTVVRGNYFESGSSSVVNTQGSRTIVAGNVIHHPSGSSIAIKGGGADIVGNYFEGAGTFATGSDNVLLGNYVDTENYGIRDGSDNLLVGNYIDSAFQVFNFSSSETGNGLYHNHLVGGAADNGGNTYRYNTGDTADSESGGEKIFTGDGSTRVFSVAHGLISEPDTYGAQQVVVTSAGEDIEKVQVDAADLTVTFDTAPTDGEGAQVSFHASVR